VTVGGRLEQPLPRPATVAIEDHGHMPRKLLRVKVAANATLIETVKDASSEGNFPLCHTLTLVQPASSIGQRRKWAPAMPKTQDIHHQTVASRRWLVSRG
jgi:hypothetical protein